ncbi:MAG TPA: ABC transporter permease [Bryobacteraceae bacterium]|jgi:predicted permease
MSARHRVSAFFKLLFRREKVEAELDAEVQAFYETMVDRYVERGMPRQEARRLARLKFNLPEQVKEEVRDARTGAALAAFAHEVKYALRTVRKTPSLAVVTVLTLALGIGANSTIFSIVSRFVLRAPPVGNPGTLMALHTTHDHEQCCNSFTWPLFLDVREQAKSFSGVAGYYDLVPASMGGTGEPERVWGQAATANFFDVAQLGMALGRGFTKDEENIPVVVLGNRLWRHRFGADPAIAGKTITLSGHPFTVVGVAPPVFRGLDFILDCQFWVPLGNLDQLLPNTSNRQSRFYHWLTVVGRLKPGMTRTQAAAELSVLAQRLAKAHPESEKGGGFRFEPAGSLPPRDKDSIMMFLAALTLVAILVLCIACANVANIFLAHASGRQREMAVRLTLGATRRHLLNQLLTESVLLALGGGLLGAALSFWATRGLAAFRFPAPVPLDLNVSVDWRVLLYTFILSVAAGVLFGLVPAWSIVRPLIANGLKGEDVLARPGRVWSLRNVLVVSQIAMSLVLLCATGLFLRSLKNASEIDTGFRSSGVLIMSVDPRLHGYSPERTTQFLNQLQQRVAALPGVTSTAYTDTLPLSGGHRSDGFSVEGLPASNVAGTSVELYMAGPGYFDTIGIPRVAGRDFANEIPTAPKVAIVNQAFAQRFFKNETPLGRRVSGGGRTYQIVGVVKNIKSRFIGEDIRPVLYRALAQDIAGDPSFTGYSVLVRFARDPGPLAAAVRREIHSLDPTLAIFDVRTMQEHLRDALFLPRLAGTLFGIFGFLGLSLAAVGLYGVMNYWVSRRTREIGIRLALGAQIGGVQRLIIRQGMTLTCVAIVPGLAAAWAVAKLFTSVLYGVPAHDAAIFTVVPLLLTAVALFACWLPSRRAASAEPLMTLRHE